MTLAAIASGSVKGSAWKLPVGDAWTILISSWLNLQVSIMQQELKELQPELIQTSKETEQLITIIADETVEVEDKKQVSSISNK